MNNLTVARAVSAFGLLCAALASGCTSIVEIPVACDDVPLSSLARFPKCCDDPKVQAYDLAICRPGGMAAAPTMVAGFQAIGQSTDTIALSWTPSTGQTSYRVERSPSGANVFAPIVSLDANATSYTDAGLPADSAFDYVIFAVNDVGGVPSETKTARTLAVLPPVPGATSTSPLYIAKAQDGNAYLCFPANGAALAYATLATAATNGTPVTSIAVTSNCAKAPSGDQIGFVGTGFVAGSVPVMAYSDYAGTMTTSDSYPGMVMDEVGRVNNPSTKLLGALGGSGRFGVITWSASTGAFSLVAPATNKSGVVANDGFGRVR